VPGKAGRDSKAFSAIVFTFTSLLSGVAVSRAETPNFIIKHALRGNIGLARHKALGKLISMEPAGVVENSCRSHLEFTEGSW
jgi:hypothetical protein